MRLADFGLVAKNGEILKEGGRKPHSQKELELYLYEKDVPGEKLRETALALMREAQKSVVIELSYDEYLQAKKELFEGCIYNKHLKTIKTETGILAYIKSDTGWTSLGLAKHLNPKDLYIEFSERYSDEVRELRDKLIEITPKGKGRVMKHEEVAEMFLEDMIPSDERRTMDSVSKPPYPLLLEGDNRPAFGYLKYKRNDNPILNPYMLEFLGRMHNHEYFCGYLFCTFLGIEIQQLLYLFGAGMNGKSSFTKLLASKTRSVAAFSEESKHHLTVLEKAAFIIISENESGHLLLKPIIKKITGKDLLTFDYKFKSIYSGRAPGTIIVDSNSKPYVLGEKSETRRLRLFEIQPTENKEAIDATLYEQLLGENFNDFINYCRLCYEKLKQKDGILIKDPPDLDKQIETLIDRDAEAHYNTMLAHLKTARWNIDIGEELSIGESDFRQCVLSACRMLNGKFQDQFFSKNFLKYLSLRRDIKEKDGVLYGIGRYDRTKDKAILDAMPKY